MTPPADRPVTIAVLVNGVIAATTEYGGTVVAAVEQGSMWATQFHPEKSAANGLALLRNFAEACSREQP